MAKPFPALFLTLCLFLTLSVPGMAVQTDTGTQLEILPPEPPVSAGEVFTVTVNLRGNPGFCMVQFTLTFDRDKMDCIEAQAGTLLENALCVTNPAAEEGAILAAASGTDIPGDGTLLTLKFEAKENLEEFPFGLENVILSRMNRTRIAYTVTGAEIAVPEVPDTASESANHTVPESAETPESSMPENSGERNHTGEIPLNPPDEPDIPGGLLGTQIPENAGMPESGIPENKPATDNTGETAPSGTTEQTVSSGATEQTSGTVTVQFTDTAGNWAESYIAQAAQQGLFNGYPDGSFRPDNVLVRSEFVLVLWNLAGQPEPSAHAPFQDVADRSERVRKAVSWAWQEGLINGTSPDTFTPGGSLTRQAAMKILFAFSGGTPGMETLLFPAYDNRFADSYLLNDWAKPAMYWGVYHGIINGTSADTLSPGLSVTRAQLAAIMVRYTSRFPSAQ